MVATALYFGVLWRCGTAPGAVKLRPSAAKLRPSAVKLRSSAEKLRSNAVTLRPSAVKLRSSAVKLRSSELPHQPNHTDEQHASAAALVPRQPEIVLCR